MELLIENKKKQHNKARIIITFGAIGILLIAGLMLAMQPSEAKDTDEPAQIIWLPPLSVKDEYTPCCKIPIRFKIRNETGRYLWDKSVEVTVVNEMGKIVYKAEYKPGGNGVGSVKIYTGRYYFTYWHATSPGYEFKIYVTFDDWPGVQFSKTVYIG